MKDRIKAGELFPVDPVMPDDPIRRTMLASVEIHALLSGPWRNQAMERRCGQLRATLEAFVKGDQIGICLTPYKAGPAYMARLHKPEDEVWDIRVRDPKPAIRVLGRFGAKNLFVALLWAPRSTPLAWSPRQPLGEANSREWRDAIVACKTKWTKLFRPYEPIQGASLHDYVSENCFLV